MSSYATRPRSPLARLVLALSSPSVPTRTVTAATAARRPRQPFARLVLALAVTRPSGRNRARQAHVSGAGTPVAPALARYVWAKHAA